MRASFQVIVVALSLLSAGIAHAGTVPGVTWPFGSIGASAGPYSSQGPTCELNFGPSSFGSGASTFIVLPEIDYYPPGDYSFPTFSYFGSAHLAFSSANAGALVFDNYNALYGSGQTKPAPLPVTFSSYTTTQPDLHTLNVSFNVTIQGCSFPVSGTYHHV